MAAAIPDGGRWSAVLGLLRGQIPAFAGLDSGFFRLNRILLSSLELLCGSLAELCFLGLLSIFLATLLYALTLEVQPPIETLTLQVV
ncbi:MAG: hypothetical protein HC838_03470 [Spirulinaceae cyanobacterium RM2_2_10]|nr:hypothetical protein [Spirulinaceae cyanobacterium SM2_1_0]NJO19309.1 hypothetical protein [Spirulinaceae cyanobacterium RM2_2_10]